VYAGNSLRGYGNLVIVKHDNTYLTAYAHNRNLLVKEGESVRKGQTIAEMGDTDANSVRLHFELRVNGKPVDPIPFLQ
jgi:lipoprotein NlpD